MKSKKFERKCGIKLFWTRGKGIDGKIRENPEDFEVEEIPLKWEKGEAYTYFLMKKKNLTTSEAVERISRNLRVGRDKIGYSGNKDKRALTKQYVSIPSELVGKTDLDLSGIKLSESGTSSNPLKLGDLKGNKFKVTIRDIRFSKEEVSKRLSNLINEIKIRGIPNFYGDQRFGAKRPISHRVGREILKGRFEKAVDLYLTKSDEEKGATKEAREKLSNEKDYEAALEYFPKYLKYERLLLRSLKGKDQEDYIQALKNIPLNLRRLFVHSYQSYLFNSCLSEFLKDKERIENFPAPVVGYQTKLEGGFGEKGKEFNSILKSLLKKEGINPRDFKVKEMEKLSSKGGVRALMIENLEIKKRFIKKDELNPEKIKVCVEFKLKPNRYATVVLRELQK